MERHRYDQIRVRREFPTSAREPSSKSRSTMSPIPVLEAGHKIAADVVVKKHRTGPFKYRTRAHAGPAKCIGTMIKLKRHAAGVTEWRGDKCHSIPANRTQGTRFRHKRIAGQALRWQNGIERRARNRTQDA